MAYLALGLDARCSAPPEAPVFSLFWQTWQGEVKPSVHLHLLAPVGAFSRFAPFYLNIQITNISPYSPPPPLFLLTPPPLVRRPLHCRNLAAAVLLDFWSWLGHRLQLCSLSCVLFLRSSALFFFSPRASHTPLHFLQLSPRTARPGSLCHRATSCI